MSVTLIISQRSSVSFLLDIMAFTCAVFWKSGLFGSTVSLGFFFSFLFFFFHAQLKS